MYLTKYSYQNRNCAILEYLKFFKMNVDENKGEFVPRLQEKELV